MMGGGSEESLKLKLPKTGLFRWRIFCGIGENNNSKEEEDGDVLWGGLRETRSGVGGGLTLDEGVDF